MRIFFLAHLILLLNILNAQTPAIVKEVGTGNFNGIPSITNSTIVDNTLFFLGNDNVNGSELWKSDGTDAGTVLVKDIYVGNQGSQIVFYKVFNNQLYFKAYNPDIGEEIWRTDDLEGAKLLIGDACPGSCSGAFNGSSFNIMTEFGGKLYFKLITPNEGAELWSTDGTEANASLLKDIYSGSSDANPYSLTVFQNKLYFVAASTNIGSELWVTDGTSEGTHLVKNINTSPFGGSDIDAIIVGPDAFYFWAKKNSGEGKELWKSDGTEIGTVQLKEIRPGLEGGQPDYVYLSNSAWLNNQLLFVANDGVSGAELWITDGTEAGTQLLKDINAGAANSDIEFLTVLNGKAYFRAKTTANGNELWSTDGTESGTQLLKDINPGTGDGLYFQKVHFAQYNDKIYFTGNNGTTGRELWITDGTAAGTQLLFDLNPGSAESQPSHFQIINDNLYFFAQTPASGGELWKLPLTTSATHHPERELVVRIYPTLAPDGQFYFDYTGNQSEQFDITVFDATGRTVHQNRQSLDKPLRLANLTTGTYLARIVAYDGRFNVQQIVVGQ